MAEYIVDVNQDNTISLPTDVRNKLVLEPGDRMVIRLDRTQEHMIVGKAPIEPMEKAAEIKNSIGRKVSITE